MPNDTTPEVLIVGAGPVGLTLAHDLSRRGLRVRVIDRAAGPSQHSKALAIFARTIEELDAHDLAETFLEGSTRLRAAVVHADGREIARVQFDELPCRYPFVLIVPQSRTEMMLLGAVEARGVQVDWAHELVGIESGAERVVARIRHPNGTVETVEVPYLVACDGAHSTVRHELNLAFAGERRDEVFVLADVAATGAFDPECLHLHFAREGVLALVPMGGGQARIVANLPPDRAPNPAIAPTLDEVRALTHERAPIALHLDAPQWTSHFHISRRMVKSMQHGRVFLCGDAAHIHSPAGGQGMNTGMQDAWNLGWKLALRLRGRAGDRLLASYDAERRPVAASVLAGTDALTRMATLHGGFAQSLRNGMLHLLSGMAPMVETAAESLAELRVGYRHSPVIAHHGHAAARVKAGDRAPDATLRRYDGGETRTLHRWLRDGRHVLLACIGFDATERTQLDDVRARVAGIAAEEITVLPIGADEAAGDLTDAWHDVDGRLHVDYGAEDGALILIRPDGYVGYRGAGLEGAPLEQYWTENFVPAEEASSPAR